MLITLSTTSFSPISNISLRKHFNHKSCGVIRNQRPKIHLFKLVSTVGGPFRKISKIDCKVI